MPRCINFVLDVLSVVDHLMDDALYDEGLTGLLVRKSNLNDVAFAGKLWHVKGCEVGVVLIK